MKLVMLIHHSPLEMLDIRPDLPAAQEIFPNTEIGFDGMEVEF